MKIFVFIALTAFIAISQAMSVTKMEIIPTEENDVTCPDQSQCPEGQTCCADLQGGYACCPLPKAVCCSDKLHCCPSGYKCDVSGGRCLKGNDIQTWFSKQPAKPAPEVKVVTCPDQSMCQDGQTCCQDQQGGYACCPLPKAVCCSDKLHCCPSGYQCDVSGGRCLKGNDIQTWFTKQPAKPSPEVNTVTCPDQSRCPDGNTCCQDQRGGFACCPLPKAVCCSDKLHCCPSGYQCDVSAGRCLKGNDILIWFTKQPARPAPEVNSVTCPDQSRCQDGQTCCEDQQGGYACCPLPKAVCCSDKLHCCPSGYRCDVSGGICLKGNDIQTWFTKQPAKPAPEVNSVTCPDQSRCPDGNTCCEDQQGGYACCPLPKAVCCSDKLHCCPSGYQCDVSAGRCLKGNDILIWFTKQPAKPAPEVNTVTCPDQSRCQDGQTCCEDQQGGYACCPLPKNDVTCPDQSQCPEGQTCCADLQGGYACCPLPKAVCCSDKLHCCPSGYQCDVSGGRCLKGNDIQTWFTKQPAKPAPEVNSVTCPDQSRCQDGQTCCEDQQGGYACCPLPKAVCCSDKLHCCPSGYRCDVSAGICLKGNDIQTWFTKQPAKPAPEVNTVTCPDQSRCPDGNTCCEDQQGGYACCPLPKAVCCSDKLHCCPSGYQCDVSAGRCLKGNDIQTWFTKQPARPAPEVNSVTCPDQSRCQDGQTCCEDQQGGYACCPLPKAVCCSDKLHCCPSGYRCDVSAGICLKGNDIQTWFTKQPAKPAPEVKVTCPDQSMCQDGQTCCQDQQGGYACCPLPKAVCCSDKLHCCPSGYQCDVSAGRCLKGNDIQIWFTKQPAKPAPEVNTVTCPDQSRCPDGNTCCEDQQGGYACCPLPKVSLTLEGFVAFLYLE
ncbi:granulin epithelin variant 1 [Plakobranchus ocellatus]|uniref:Granulin epithelin variant 1 n=1 Tax=Plakobranchus ocellatus TaxID=259542 RepID=A0AAV4CGD7_9GAST|nr:granulin epithelin variant 1 [Plakobranchus ocellatus]